MGRKFFTVLMAVDAALLASGSGFAVYSFITGSSFTIMGNRVPGFVFAAVAIFLGVRYMRALLKLNRTIKGSGKKFSWDNFRWLRKCSSLIKG